jgi:hypothetical protein
MGYVIKLNHRKGGTIYLAAVPVPTDQDDPEVRKLQRQGLYVSDCENTNFESFEEASKFPYPTAEVAADVVFSLPKTKNIDYEVVEVKGR